MSGNEFRFFLSCDINLPVTFKIERLEGKLSPVKPPDSDDSDYIEERKPELYVECLLYVDGAPFGLPMRTRLESVGPSYCWNELVTLSTKYRDLTANSQLALTVYDVSCGKNEEVVGGATIHLFNMKKQLKTGKHKLRLWAGKEADGSINTTTPGKVPKEERGELERLEKLVNKYERGQIQRVDWLDRLAFKAMEKIKERESIKKGGSHLYAVVDFCSFEHRVVFQESGANFLIPSPIASTNELVTVKQIRVEEAPELLKNEKELYLTEEKSDTWSKKREVENHSSGDARCQGSANKGKERRMGGHGCLSSVRLSNSHRPTGNECRRCKKMGHWFNTKVLPHLMTNIVSLDQLGENGYKVDINDVVVRIKDPDGQLLAEMMQITNRMYKLHIKMTQSSFLVCAVAVTSDWAGRPGVQHVSGREEEVNSFFMQVEYLSQQHLEQVHSDLCSPITSATPRAGADPVFSGTTVSPGFKPNEVRPDLDQPQCNGRGRPHRHRIGPETVNLAAESQTEPPNRRCRPDLTGHTQVTDVGADL
ncbi:Phosphatidylinositol 3-kinase VPS34 [Striga hermonthica]|uniref:Phosphatidylinositol 3-kinase VPS34 n=1 Tax=Striga hermonthica TaxID=68872 RepID=A0A9N7MQQ1_STRHE|nr:Phosphatidylinositol 3-kinase VPS34 [Striga hermonthica]